jgi:hypothetical protein
VADLAPILPKLGKLIRLFDSDQRGEIAATFHGLKRTLASANAKFGDLGNWIDLAANDKRYTEEEMQAIVEELRKDYAPRANGHGAPSPDDMARWCHERRDNHRLRAKDREFVADMYRRVTVGVAQGPGRAGNGSPTSMSGWEARCDGRTDPSPQSTNDAKPACK